MKLGAAAFACALVAAAPVAHANGRLPAANQLVVAPDDPATLVLRTTFGMLFSHDAGQTWDWLCESAYMCQTNGICTPPQQDPAIALLNGGTVVAAEIEGLATSPDRGCSWSFVPGTAMVNAIDTTRAPDGATAIALVSNLVDGSLMHDSRVLQTVDAGKSWQPLPGVIDPTLVLDTIDLAPSNPQRIYVTGQVFGDDHATLLVSDDGGQSYQSHAIAFVAGEGGAYVAGVDPVAPDRVYVRTLGTSDGGAEQFSRLLVSNDAGQSFNEAWTGDKLLGFALSKDGSRVYVGSALAGLEAANASDLVFTQKSALQVGCLATAGDTLYVCAIGEGNAQTVTGSAFIIGATLDEGASFTPLLRLETIHAPLDCAPSTTAAACVPQWPALELQLGIDAGVVAGPDAGTTGGCGCQSTSPTREGALFAAAIALVLTLRSRPSRGAR